MADIEEKQPPAPPSLSSPASPPRDVEIGGDGHGLEPSQSPASANLGLNANDGKPGTPPLQATTSRLQRARQRLGARPACFATTLQEVLFVGQATAATATTAILSGVSVVVLAAIGRDLGMTQGQVSWITASTTLTAGACQLALGQLADLLGRRLVFVSGMGLFAAGSLLVAFAHNPLWMDAVCGLLGVGAAMVVPPAVGILGAAYDRPSRRKNAAFSAFSAGNPVGFVFGSVMCGVAARVAGWRAAYVLLAIIWAALTALSLWTVPRVVEAYDPRETVKQRLTTFVRKFDSVGTVLTIFGTGLFTAGVTLGPENGWGSASVIAMTVVGVALLVLFAFWERTYPHPLMPPHIWKDKNFTFIIIVVTLGSMAFTSAGFWLPLFMQKVQGLDPLTVAVHLLPQVFAGILWNIIAGQILHRINNTLILAVGALCYVTSNLLLSLMRPDSVYWAYVFPALVLNVVGADFHFNVANMYVMQSLPSQQQALAGGIFNMLVRLSTTIALGISTAVYSSVAETPAGVADPMLGYTRAFQVSVALSGASVFFLPFIKLGTQGNWKEEEDVSRVENGKGRGEESRSVGVSDKSAGMSPPPPPPAPGQAVLVEKDGEKA